MLFDKELSDIVCNFLTSVQYSETTRLNVTKILLINSIVSGKLFENDGN